MNVDRYRRLVRAVLLSAGPASAMACSGGEPTIMPERAQCIDPRGPNRYAALTLASGVDGIAFATRGDGTFNPPSADDPPPKAAERLPDLGTPCGGATNRSACEQRVAGLIADLSTPGWELKTAGRGPLSHMPLLDLGVITVGDTVRVATFADVLAAASPIDTRDEAAAVLLLQSGLFDCDDDNARPEADGWTFKSTSKFCDGEVTEHFSRVTSTGKIVDGGFNTVTKGDDSCVEGRRPPNLASTKLPWLSSLAACFSEIAHMEEAAVLAFDELDRQLRALRAPWELLMRVARARADEVEHAALTARLAVRFGGRTRMPRVEGARDPHAADALLQLALENATEGCVREAYGALVAAHQAAHATDVEVRTTFARIAAEEAEHAELSFALDAWLASRLPSALRRRVEDAKAKAWMDLANACNVEPSPEVVKVAGMPTASEARTLLARLHYATLAA